MSVPGMVASSSFGYLQMVLGFVAGQLIIAFILTPLFYRMNLVSIYEYLENRFGMSSYHTGAWFFFISKMLGAAVRLFLVCLTLQLLVFEPFGLPFILNVAITVALVWLIHIPRWSEITYLDRFLENFLPCCLCGVMHLLHSFRPEPVSYKHDKHDCRQ